MHMAISPASPKAPTVGASISASRSSASMQPRHLDFMSIVHGGQIFIKLFLTTIRTVFFGETHENDHQAKEIEKIIKQLTNEKH